MKKKLILIGLPILLLLALFFAAPALTRNRTSTAAAMIDLFNPRIGNSTLYLKTSETYDDTYKDAANGKDDYSYITVSYDEQGQSRKIMYTAFGSPLAPNKYLKVQTKGQYVRSYEEVRAADLPEAVLAKLK